MSSPIQDLFQFVRDSTIHPLAGASGVPSARNLLATAPLTVNGGASANLGAGDITIAGTIVGGGASLVGAGRLIIGTSPVTINGGASHDLTTDITIAVPSFAGTTPGLVPVGTNNAGLFLAQTGWVAGTIVGVSSVAASGAITVSAATGAVTIGSQAAGLANPGHVPALGSADASQFLCKTNPPTFAAVPNIGTVVTLQGSSPGTADVGNVHITGTIIADSVGMFGHASSTGAAGNPNFPTGTSLAIQTQSGSDGLFLMQSSGTSGNNQFWMRKTRGTIASPTATQANDLLGNMVFLGRGSGGASNTGAVIESYADGAPAASQPAFLDLVAGDLDNTIWTTLRVSKAGVAIFNGATDLSKRAASILDLQASLGLKTTVISGNTTADNQGCVYLIDGTASAVNLTLPTAVGCAGRVYSASRIDNIGFTHDVKILTTGGQTIDGAAQAQLYYAGNFITVVSDGSNWWSISSNKPAQNSIFSNPISDTIANNTGPLGFATGFILDTNTKYTKGGTFRIHYHGVVSCTGTPTLTLTLYFITGPSGPSTSGAYTMPSGITSALWSFEGRAVLDESGNIVGLGSIFYMPVSTPPNKTVPVIGVDGGTTFSTPSNFGLQVQWSAADPANTITCKGAYMDYYPPGHHA